MGLATSAARAACRAAADWRPETSLIPAALDVPAPDGAPLRGYRHDTLSGRYRRIARIMPPTRGRPARPNTPAPTTPPRGSWPRTATPSPWRTAAISTWAQVVGQTDGPFQPRHAGGRARSTNATRPAGGSTGPAPAPPRSASTACAGLGSRKPCPGAPMPVRTAVCSPTATSPRRCSRPASTSPIPTIRAPRGSTSDLPTPSGRGRPPNKRGREHSQPAPATSTTRWCRTGQDRQPPPHGGGLC